MRKRLLLVVLFLLALGYDAEARTRQECVDDAKAHETIDSWTASTNSYTFAPNEMFKTLYSTGVSYNEWPYVYGGRENSNTTSSRINNGTCPGGRYPATGNSTEDIYVWWAADPNNRPQPTDRLAGIDCAGFVMRMLGVTSSAMLNNTSASLFKNYCVSISSTQIRLGDVLVAPKHIRMVSGTAPLMVAEAAGGSVGRVVVTTASLGSYLPYTPFPVFSDFSPSSGTVVTSSHPVISFIINSGTGISASTGVVVRLDGTEIQPTITSPEAKKYRVTYTPEVGLANGRHVLHVWATNSMGLEEGAEHYFNVSETEHIEFGLRDTSGNDLSINRYASIEILNSVL